jgi:uncharacterized repeat protein (TIGR03803 family)
MLKIKSLAVAVVAAFAMMSPSFAATWIFTPLHSFTATPDGREPAGGLTPHGGVLYGTTNVGGDFDSGTIYRIDPATGVETVLYSFRGFLGKKPDGSLPQGELAAAKGTLYGTTSFGGKFSGGTLFKFDIATGVETVLHSFGKGTDGAIPAVGPAIVDGILYGTTSSGGKAGLGTVFALDLATGGETVLHHFQGGDDGATPFAPVIHQGGLLYGTTFFGGPSNNGTVFSLDPRTRVETVLHAFTGASFSGNPAAGLSFHDGMLYGTTAHGGLPNCGGGCGSVFQVDAATGAESDLYRFSSTTDGRDPEGGLVLHGHKLFGTTLTGGVSGLGTVFSIQIQTGAKTTLHDFGDELAPGQNPGTLISFGGSLYGTTHGGGGAGQGTVFELAK